jgi:hypothetical protein
MLFTRGRSSTTSDLREECEHVAITECEVQLPMASVQQDDPERQTLLIDLEAPDDVADDCTLGERLLADGESSLAIVCEELDRDA